MCTGIFIPSDDGQIYQSRTLEFGLVMNYQKYISNNIIGITTNGNFLDGLNIHGLCAMSFYFKCNDSYNPVSVDGKTNLASYEVVDYFLNNATSVDDVISLSNNINITQQPFGPPFNSVLPLHWFISDKSGKTIIVEAINNGFLTCYDNTLYKVCTNNPTYPEQVSALQTLINSNNFSYCNPPGSNCGLGKGLVGMPGDYSSMSRFQRAYLLTQGMIIPGYNTNNINTIFHLNNNFDIVYGTVQDCIISPPLFDFTQYTVVYDLVNLTAYYKTYHNQTITLLGTLNVQQPRYYPPYLQPMSKLGTSNRTWGAISVGLNGNGSANRIYKFLKRADNQ